MCSGLVLAALVLAAGEHADAAPEPFKVVAHRQDHRALQLDKSFMAQPLRIGSKTFARGLGTHANSLTVIELGKGCKTFKSQIGADLNDPTRKAGGSVVFIVKTDGKERFRSQILKPGDEPVAVSVDLTGAKRLELITDTSIKGYTGDHADWADARITLTSGKDAYISDQIRRGKLPAKLPAPPARPKTGPTEPETRTLTEDEAQAQLQAEWLFQAEGKPLAARALQEIAWARDIAARLRKAPKPPKLTDYLTGLDVVEKHLKTLPAKPDPKKCEKLYFIVREIKRKIIFADPLVDFSRMLFVDIPERYPHESMHRVYPQAQLNCVRLLVLDGLSPAGKLRKLTDKLPAGWYWRPDLSFDAKRVLFCFRPKTDRTFHLYETSLDSPDAKPRQLTHGSYDDLDPIYMPSGHVVFVSNRGASHARCTVGHPSTVVARCDADGKNIYLISGGNEPEYTPALMPNGQILYTRWEYTDKELMRIQSLWTVNPDGTGTNAFWGNQSYWPDMLVEARAIPGKSPAGRRVMFSGQGHHNVYWGSLGIVDPKKGRNYPDGLTKVTQDVRWCEVGDGPEERPETTSYHTSGAYRGYKSPYPLSDELFLVSARASGRSSKFKLFLMDIYGNRELIYESAFHALYGLPIRPRKAPPVIPDRVEWAGAQRDRRKIKPGVFFCADVYQGAPKILQNKAKYLRVIQLDWNTATLGKKLQDVKNPRGRPHLHVGPVVSLAVNDGVKHVLGTVPVKKDGSVYFEAPPCQSLHFQLLDEHHRTLQTMRSFTNVMPGELRGCVGCHEDQDLAPTARSGPPMKGPPAKLTPYPWGSGYSFGYERDVQPILDKYCGKCHQGKGKGRKKLDMTLRPSKDMGVFPEPYVTLVLGDKRKTGGGFVRSAEGGAAGTILAEVQPWRPQDYRTTAPMTAMSYKSKLVANATSGKHNKVKVDSLSGLKLIMWVDLLCPYRGEKELRAMADPDPNDPMFKRSNYPPSDVTITDVYAQSPYRPRMATAPIVNRAYRQDEFPTTESRLPKDAKGNILSPVTFGPDGQRIIRTADGVATPR
jgi:hypothetical protein